MFKKINFPKIRSVLSFAGAVIIAGLVFQNFTPHDSFAGHDTRDLYMDDALTEALRQEKRAQKELEKASIHENTNQSSNQSTTARVPASLVEVPSQNK